MITEEYINFLKQSAIYTIIEEGLLQGKYEDVVLGEGNFRITNQYDNSMIRTIPSQILIIVHVLIIENKIKSENFHSTFKKIEITDKNTLLLIEYIKFYLIYRKEHKAIFIDYKKLLLRIIFFDSKIKEHCKYIEVVKQISDIEPLFFP